MTLPASHLFQPLLDGPIDIVGDIHGEIDALQTLLAVLGYRDDGSHPDGRHPIFIGDLCDRGPDSPAVIAFVADLVERGLAQCVLGNHELNILCDQHKEGNGWFYATDHDLAIGKFPDVVRNDDDSERRRIRSFFAQLPVVLERNDLRVIHAAWDDDALRLLQGMREPTVAIHRDYDERATLIASKNGLVDEARAEYQHWGSHLQDPTSMPPLLSHLGRLDAFEQMSNPLRVITSGPEALATEPFYAAGKWRMVDRVRWWQHYEQNVPVVIGHYWRWPKDELRRDFTRGEKNLFDGAAIDQWLGARRNVYCVDFGVGARYKERAAGRKNFATRLGALRWPEREVVTDDGARMKLQPGLSG